MSLLDRLSFNQITADPWSLEQVVRNCSHSGIPFIAVWRHKLGDVNKAAAMIRNEGLRVSSLCRGGSKWGLVFKSSPRNQTSYLFQRVSQFTGRLDDSRSINPIRHFKKLLRRDLRNSFP